MDLRQMEYFLAVVDNGGVNRAAAALRVAQPSLSQSLRRLEKDLGTQLFHRVGRGLVLAPAGEALVGPARMILRETEAAVNTVRSFGRINGGRIDIASLSDISTDPLSVWAAQFRLENPDVTFRIEERDNTSDVIDLVRSGSCEIGFTVSGDVSDDLERAGMAKQEFVLVAPPGTDAEWGDPVRLEDLRDVPLVMASRGSATREHIDSALRSHGVVPRIGIEVPQHGAVLPIILAGGGVAIVPLRSALDAHVRGAVVRELEPRVTRPMYAVRRRGYLTPVAGAFLAFPEHRLAEWYGAIARQRAKGRSLVEAATLTTRAMDRRMRLRNLQRKYDDQGK